MTPSQEASLTGGGDSFDHWHSSDRQPTQDFLQGLGSVAKQVFVSGDTVLTGQEDFLAVDTQTGNITITMPRAINGLEIEIMKLVPANTIFIIPDGTDTIFTTTGVTLSVGNAAIRFKAIGTDWRAI